MSLAAYTAFLASPTTAALADNASIHYIPTLTSIHDASAILKHLAAQAKLLTKKGERVLSVVQGRTNLCVETETVIEFLSGGGAFVPGLDDNFLSDKIVRFPVFDEQKISQIRLYWDQGSLLKQLEVIGSRAKNWPIRDGTEQARLISTLGSAASADVESSRRSTMSRGSGHEGRSHAGSVTSITGDPHATLSLFGPREPPRSEPESTPKQARPAIAPRSSARPPTRDLTDILAGNESEWVPPSPTRQRPVSPRKNSNGGGAQRTGSSKNYHAIRLFDDENPIEPGASPEKSVKTNAKKYKHFEFGDGEGAAETQAAPRSKHASQWDFADFVTPDKPKAKIRAHEVRHIAWSDDEDGQQSPVHRPVVHAARPDAKHHFEFTDKDEESAGAATKRPSSRHNDSSGLYKDNVTNEGDKGADGATGETDTAKKPLGTMINVDLAHRRKDFGSQFEMADDSPVPAARTAAGRGEGQMAPPPPKLQQQQPPQQAQQKQKVEQTQNSQNLAKVIRSMDASWHTYDENPDPVSKKENVPHSQAAADAAKRNNAHHWGFGAEDE